MRKENERLALENERLRLLRTAPAQLPTSAAQSAIAAPPNAETAEDRAAKHTLVMFVSEHLEPTCQALDALEEETVRSVIAGKDMQRIACYGLRCDPLYTKFWKAKERAYESVHNQTLVSLPLVEIITTIERIRADYDTFRYRTLRMTNNNRLSSIEYPKWVDI